MTESTWTESTSTESTWTESTSTESTESATPAVNLLRAVLVWLWVTVPFGYGLYQLVVKIPALFSN